jgi:hypothetical protein
MYPGEELLHAIDVHTAAESVTREALIQELKKTTQSDFDPRTGMQKDFSALTVFSKEFTVFLGYNNTQLIMDLTDWYDCSDHWKYRTKTQGTDSIRGVWVNILGATTPSQLQSSLPMDAIGGGLSSRMIFIYEDVKGKSVPFPDGINWVNKEGKTTTDKALSDAVKEKLIDDLMEIKQQRGEFAVDDSFLPLWETWYTGLDGQELFAGTFLEPYETRRATHLLKLCMIMSMNRDGKLVITGDDFKQALAILEAVEQKMPSTFRGVGKNEDSFVIGRVLNILIVKKEIYYNELLEKLLSDVSNEQLMRSILSLVKIGKIELAGMDDKGNSLIKFIRE